MEIEQGLEKDRTKRSSAASPELLRKILKIAFEYSSGYSKDKGEYLFSRTGSSRLLYEDETSGKIVRR